MLSMAPTEGGVQVTVGTEAFCTCAVNLSVEQPLMLTGFGVTVTVMGVTVTVAGAH